MSSVADALSRNCPNCTRAILNESEIRFCMYCGHRLSDTDSQADVREEDSPGEPSTIQLAPFDSADPSAPSNVETTDFITTTVEQPVERIGAFRLLKKLGTGGMGHVFEAESDETGERVALKLLSPKLVTNPNSVERFKQEGRLASQISHPRCVFVYGVDADEGRPFIVMELMPGSTLKDLIDSRGPLPWVEAIYRILDVIEGLIEAHRLGMLHRDVKPSNCFLTEDNRVKIGDFGLSKSLDSQQQRQLTSTGAFLGTVLFAPPEQIRGNEVGYESDVYSVAATMYYLLVGKAPHHHISMTAALAKAISEPPPSIRAKRADVPAALERIIFKGLERERNRRYASLEELRDALLDILPERQQPSRVRSLVGAYLIDFLICVLVLAAPFEWLLEWLFHVQVVSTSILSELIQYVVLVLYFGLSEGLTGGTLGKLLLRLRVTRKGQVGPPGILRAMLRAAVFHTMLVAIIIVVVTASWYRPWGLFLACATVLSAAVGLLYQRRTSPTHQGLHDLASKCRVVQRPRPVEPIRLVGLGENPLDNPKKDPALPPLVGGFNIVGVLTELDDGAMVWVAEDAALNRRILLWLRPARHLPDGIPASPVRPGRLRIVSTGELVWNNGVYAWVAFVAPTGAPLSDTISPENRLSWANTRMLLEQLIAELKEGIADRTTPPRLSVDQLWVEPSGRLHIVEFPLPTNTPSPKPVQEPLDLVRQVASLLLEGRPRLDGGRLRAPLPVHATRITNKLLDPKEPMTLESLAEKLAANHSLPPEVSTGMRTFHVGVLLAISGLGLLMMLAVSLAFTLFLSVQAFDSSNRTQLLLRGLAMPEVVNRWRQGSPALAESLKPENLATSQRKLNEIHARETALWEQRYKRLSRVERMIVDWRHAIPKEMNEPGDTPQIRRMLENRLNLNTQPVQDQDRDDSTTYTAAAIRSAVSLLLVLFVFSCFAFAFRGGLSYAISGIAIVTADGRPASRSRCAARECAIWLPLCVLLMAHILLQSQYPEWMTGRVIGTIVIALAFLGYLLIAIRYPTRGPHDKLAGTYMVPG